MQADAENNEQEKKEEEVDKDHLAELKAQKYGKLYAEEILPYTDALYSFALFHTKDSTNADDLLQETLLKAYRFIESFEQGSNAKAWLFTIMRNEFINSYRKKSKRPTKVDYEEVTNFHNEEEDTDFSTYVDLREELFDQMMGDEVVEAMEKLSPEFREVIILCDIEDLKYEEIAEIVGIKLGTVRSRLHRARNALKLLLEEYGREQGYLKNS